jgi:hypothetical protein
MQRSGATMDVNEIYQIELKLLKLEYLRQQYNRNSRKYYWNKVVAQKQKIAQQASESATSPTETLGASTPPLTRVGPQEIPTVEIGA